jgi:hypothetical protein
LPDPPDSGWTDGRNVRMDLRWAGGDINRSGPLAQELVGLQPDIILASSVPATAALQRQTRTIPIVFASASDPVASGLVPRLNQPTENVTGFATLEATLAGKWLELLSEIAPGLKRAAIMFNPETNFVSSFMPSFETAARSLKVEPIVAPVHSDGEIETAITVLGREPGGGLVVLSAAVWPVAGSGQQRPVPVIGYLNIQSADNYKFVTVPFLQSLKDAGFVAGQNVAIEYRWAEERFADGAYLRAIRSVLTRGRRHAGRFL